MFTSGFEYNTVLISEYNTVLISEYNTVLISEYNTVLICAQSRDLHVCSLRFTHTQSRDLHVYSLQFTRTESRDLHVCSLPFTSTQSRALHVCSLPFPRTQSRDLHVYSPWLIIQRPSTSRAFTYFTASAHRQLASFKFVPKSDSRYNQLHYQQENQQPIY